MSLENLLVLVVFASAIVLLTQGCLYAIAAVIAGGIAALIAFEVMTIGGPDSSVPLMLATISGSVGVIGLARYSQKIAIASSAVLATVCAVQIITILELL